MLMINQLRRGRMGSLEIQNELEGQRKVWKYMLSYADSMVLKAAVELGLADIIHSHGGPITLSQIASKINSSSLDISYLSRVMRMLVRKGVFTAYRPSNGKETLYKQTHVSSLLSSNSELSLAPIISFLNHPKMTTPWHYIAKSVKESVSAFKCSNGCELWDFANQNPDFSYSLNAAMACSAKVIMNAFMSEYKDGFEGIRSVVDVGGGIGAVIAEIIKSHPYIKGINFDLSHVIATAPARDGISHVGGDMFEVIPNADMAILKWVLHDWSDENCVKILKNCHKAIPENGKVIIIDIVMSEDGDTMFGDTELAFDLLMFVETNGGKERTEEEWKKILEEAGFPRYKIITMPALPSIIEAYPG